MHVCELTVSIVILTLLLNRVKESKCLKMKFSNRSDSEYKKLNSFDAKREERLIELLLRNYNPNIIPKPIYNQSLKLYIGLSMAQLINIVIRIII